MTEVSVRAYPLANPILSSEIFNLIERALIYKHVRRGANEVTKSLNRGLSEVIVMAADAEPLEILKDLYPSCVNKNVPYVFVSSRKELGRACGVSCSVVACSVTVNEVSQLRPQIKYIQDEIKKLIV